MMSYGSRRVVVLSLFILTACREAPPPGGTSRVAIQFNSITLPDAQAALRRLGAAPLNEFPRSNTQLFAVDPSNLDEILEMSGSGRLVFAEVYRADAPAVIPLRSVSVDQLPDQESAEVRNLVGTLSPADYLISEERPTFLSAEILGSVTERTTIALPGEGEVQFRQDGPASGNVNEDGLTWKGVQVEGTGRALLVARPIGISGMVTTERGAYSIIPLRSLRQLTVRTVQPKPAAPPSPRPPGDLDARALADCPQDGRILDVLVGYTKEFATAMDVRSAIDAHRVNAETVFGDSGTGIQLRVRIAAAPWPLPDGGDLAALVRGLAQSPQVKRERDATMSDAVVLMVLNSTPANDCGIAATIPASAESAYAVVAEHSPYCERTHAVFAHELGHLLGGRHDPDSDKSKIEPWYSHGISYRDFRDVMATADKCGCVPVWRFSDPLHFHKGIQFGDDERRNSRRVISENGPLVSQFRCRM